MDPIYGKKSHTVSNWTVTKEPTCTESGYTESSKCSECGEQIKSSTTIPATGHSVVVTEGKEPTCTEDGYVESGYCSECGEVEERGLQLLEHTYGEWTVSKEATCTENGENTHFCSICNEIKTEIIPAK